MGSEMAIFDLSIRVVDRGADNAGLQKQRAGDIVNAMPNGKPHGKMPMKTRLIVPVDGLTKEEARRLCSPHYPDGREQDILLEPNIHNPTPELKVRMEEKPLAKRKYNISLNKLKQVYPALDLKRVVDETDTYQPFLENNIVVDLAVEHNLIFNKHKNTFGDTRGNK